LSSFAALLLPEGAAWARPWALLALLLPLAVLLGSFRPARPEPRFTGAFTLWREVRSSGEGGRARADMPPARVIWILALILGCLALAKPEPTLSGPSQRLTVVMDRSASMDLAHPGGGTRLRAALSRLQQWLDQQSGAIALEHFDGRSLDSLDDLSLPALRTDGIHDWSSYDRAGLVWITDQAPAQAPVLAGLVASGGDAVPGAVAAKDEDRWWWDGEALAWRTEQGAGGELRLTGGVPETLQQLARLWAEERGWEVVMGPAGGASSGPYLELITPGGLPGAVAEVGRDGWRARVRGLAGAVVPGTGEPWQVDGVFRAAGRIELHWAEFQQLGGNAGAFVASWAQLFDDCVRTALDVASVEERGAAGEAQFQAPTLERVGAPLEGRTPPARWSAYLAAAAAALGVVALALSGFGRSL
jgi:hypothetical protein